TALTFPARTLLHTMAILGTDGHPGLCQEIAELQEIEYREALAELAAHGLLDPNPYESLHPVVRYSAYQDAPPSWRVHVHRRAAQHLTGEHLKQAEHLGRISACLNPAEVEVLLDAAATALGSDPATVLRWLQPIQESQRAESSELLLARAQILTGQ